MPKRVMVFIDYQNAYKGARDAFFDPTISPHKDGQFDPLAVGQKIVNAPTRPPGDYVLSQVRIYTGRPDPRKQSRTYTAHMRQCEKWTRSGVVVTPRMLRYPFDYPARKPEEKGIDVALAIDFIAHAMDNKFDIGVLFSTDTDLRPPLEFVHRRFSPAKSVEVAAWSSNRGRRALNIPDVRIWCHHLELATYNAVADTTDYNL
jgi:uncharacterized LabA/DUF88 family protein